MPTGNSETKEQTEALKELVLWCREKQIHARQLVVGELSLDFWDGALFEKKPVNEETFRGIDRGVYEGSRPEAGDPPGAGSLDEHWAKELGVDLNDGSKAE